MKKLDNLLDVIIDRIKRNLDFEDALGFDRNIDEILANYKDSRAINEGVLFLYDNPQIEYKDVLLSCGNKLTISLS